MISAIVSRLVILVFGKLYPAYASYKAVRTKDVKEYVKWMMYWIVFALFTFVETFTDLLLSFWFPFYYELKIIVVLWLLSPATRGSSILYRKFVHPTFTKREHEIDDAIRHAKAQGYKTILQLGARGVDYARYVIMQTAIKGLQGAPLGLEPFTQTRTTVDGAPPAGERNEHIPQYANGLFEPDNLDHLDAFQYSDDEDFIPPPAVKAEMEVEEEEAEPVEEKRPKRRSARSRKQKQTVHYDEDFDE